MFFGWKTITYTWLIFFLKKKVTQIIAIQPYQTPIPNQCFPNLTQVEFPSELNALNLMH